MSNKGTNFGAFFKNLTSNKSTIISLAVIALVITLVIVGSKFIKKALDSLSNTLGITDSKDEKEVEAAIASSDNIFNPSWYKSRPGSRTYSAAAAKPICAKLHACVDKWSPSETGELMGVARQFLTTKAKVSGICEQFTILYNEDLLTYLRGWVFYGFTDAELKPFIDYCNSLPNG